MMSSLEFANVDSLNRIQKNKGFSHNTQIINDSCVFVAELLHNSFYLVFTINVYTILFVKFVDSNRENYKSWWLIFTSLIEKTYFERWCFFEHFGSKPILIYSCERIIVINSRFHIAFSHFNLDCEKQSCALWIKSKMIAAIKFSKLGDLIIYTIYAAHHVGARGCGGH